MNFLADTRTSNLSETARDQSCTIEFATAGRVELQRLCVHLLLPLPLLLLLLLLLLLDMGRHVPRELGRIRPRSGGGQEECGSCATALPPAGGWRGEGGGRRRDGGSERMEACAHQVTTFETDPNGSPVAVRQQ